MKYAIEHHDGSDLNHLLAFSDWMPREFSPNGRWLTYTSLLDRYRASSWGMHQAGQPPRYAGNFEYAHAEMLEDLGDSIHPVEHNAESHQDLRAFLTHALILSSRTYDLSPFEIVSTHVAAELHDIGETTHDDIKTLCEIVVGDVPSGQKTPEHRAAERRIIEKIFDVLYTDLPDKLKTHAVSMITHSPGVHDSDAHKLLEASHNWGEYETGLDAGRVAINALERGLCGHRVTQLSRIAAVVLPKVRDQRLVPEIPSFPFIERMLDDRAAEHDRILQAVGPVAA